MSALNNARTLPALNLQAPVAKAAVAKDHPLPSAQGESSKDTFSRFLERSRADAASTRNASTPKDTGPASAARTARMADKGMAPRSRGGAEASDAADADTPANRSCAADATDTAGTSAASCKRGGEGAQASTDRPADDPATDADRPASDDEAPGAQGAAAVTDLMSMLPPGVLPPVVHVAPPTTGSADTPPAEAGSAEAPGAAASPLALLGKAGGRIASAGPAGAGPSAAAQDAAGISKDGPTFGQAQPAAAPADPTLSRDLAAQPAAVPEAALAQLAALTGRTGQTDEARKIPTALETLPVGSSAALAHSAMGPLARASDSPALPTATVSTAVTDSGFQEALATQVSVFARGGMSKAELHLNPAEMGPVSVQITMQGDQARVDFGAERAQTRQAIEAGWAALAASLQDAGFTLSGGGVSEQAGRQAAEQQAAAEPSRSMRSTSAVASDPPATSIVAARPRAGAALDLYA